MGKGEEGNDQTQVPGWNTASCYRVEASFNMKLYTILDIHIVLT
jgi:hypothetical protein